MVMIIITALIENSKVSHMEVKSPELHATGNNNGIIKLLKFLKEIT